MRKTAHQLTIDSERACGQEEAKAESQVMVSTSFEDQEWDDFVEFNVGGHYEQTSWWAQAKSDEGWQPLRVKIRRFGRIVAGAQLLFRRSRLIGRVGYVPKGPLAEADNSDLIAAVIEVMKTTASKNGINLIIAQAPNHKVDEILASQGCREENTFPVISATSCIDLTQDYDAILSRMTKTWRYNIRLAERRGVVVREGNREDIPTFFQMMLATCKRLGVTPNPSSESFIHRLWNLLPVGRHVRLLIAEYNGTAVSALFGIPFGNTFYDWKVGWTGQFQRLQTNHLLVWESIKWAKDNGYRSFDFMTINRGTAEAVLGGADFQTVAEGSTLFKLSFGGDTLLLPKPRIYIDNGAFSLAYRLIYLPYSRMLASRRH